MDSSKIRKFMKLGGQHVSERFRTASEAERKLGARLLLSEVLEYVIYGLGVEPEVGGTRIKEPDGLSYHCVQEPDQLAMLDGLADTAYTMYWNKEAFGLALEEAFDAVCDNNLQKFVRLGRWAQGERELERNEWDCGLGVTWPPEVVSVSVLNVEGQWYAVGKDAQGKVRKPSSYQPVDLNAHLR